MATIKERYFVFLILISIFCYNNFQLFGQKELWLPRKGVHLSLGSFSAVPTNSLLFPEKYEANDKIIHQPLLSEWINPNIGGYLDLGYSFRQRRPIAFGLSFRWQRLLRSKEFNFETPPEPLQEYEWRYQKNVRYFNLNFFTDYSFWSYRNFYFFARGELGLGIYRNKNRFYWSANFADSIVQGPTSKETDIVFSGELSTGIRWQYRPQSSLNLSVGYQLQSINDFVSRAYLRELNGALLETNGYPVEGSFTEVSGLDFVRPLRRKNEFLYLKLGLTHQFTGKRLKQFMIEKPILYLYPEDSLNIQVQLELDEGHEIIYDYPNYEAGEGWVFRAAPNGGIMLGDRKYYCLFWETDGKPIVQDLTEGFLVTKENARAFLEQKLSILGLNEREQNEFIVYWLPKMESSMYSAVYFAFDEYEKVSKLSITPKPDVQIRIMMIVEPLDAPIILKEQILPPKPKRTGFTVVEWGGSQGSYFQKNYDFSKN